MADTEPLICKGVQGDGGLADLDQVGGVAVIAAARKAKPQSVNTLAVPLIHGGGLLGCVGGLGLLLHLYHLALSANRACLNYCILMRVCTSILML